MIKKLSLPMIGILLVGGTVFGTYEIISSVPLSSTSIHENVLSGTEVADLNTIGGEGPYDYSLTVSGAGVDNDKFYISGSKLYLKFDPDYENPTDSGTDNKYTIEVKTLDSSKPIKYEDDYSDFYKWETMYKNGVYHANYNMTAYRQDGSIYQLPKAYDIQPPNDTGFVSVITNSNAFAGFRSDGTVYTWGNESAGAVGELSGTFIRGYSVPSVFALLRTDGSILTLGTGYRTSGAPTDAGYIKVVSNFGGFTALKADGSVYSWGDIDHSTVIDAVDTSTYPRDTGYIDIVAKAKAFAAIKADGTVVARGSASGGGTGIYTGITYLGGNNFAFAGLRADGSIKAWGDAANGGSGVPTGTGFIAIRQALYAFAAMKADGSIKAWGSAINGGSGAPTGSGYTQIVGNIYSFAALRSDGYISCWGQSPALVGAPTRAGYVSIVPGTYAFSALHADGSITYWGYPVKMTYRPPAGTGFIKIFGLANSNFAALHENGSIVKRGNRTTDPADPKVGAIFSKSYDIEILDQDEIAPIGTIVYDSSRPQRVTATLSLNESGSVTNNGGSYQYIFTETGSFVFEFADLAGNTGTAIATVDTLPSNGGGIRMVKDSCPNGDNSPSYYDRLCGEASDISLSNISSGDTESYNKGDTFTGNTTQLTGVEIYQWAKTNGLTTMPDSISARLGDPITRAELAKVMVNYLKDQEIDDSKVCEFDDIVMQSQELKGYIRQACQMGIMGVSINHFNPDGYVTRAELATIISRSFWGSDYENKGGLYYERHIQALKQKGILTNTNPLLLEARLYVFLMLMRISDV